MTTEEKLAQAQESIKRLEAAIDQHIAERQRVQAKLTQTEQWLRESQAELGRAKDEARDAYNRGFEDA